jgi:sensor domain CHASE-containing protein
MKLPDVRPAFGRAFAWLAPRARRITIPFLSGLMVASAAYTLYQVMGEQEGMNLNRLVQAEAERVRSDVAGELALRARAMRDLGARWERQRPPSSGQWEADAGQILAQDLQYRAIAWLDTSLQILRLAPTTARVAGYALDPRDDEARLDEIRALQGRREASFSSSVVLADGRRQIMVYAPMFANDRVTGCLIGVMRLRDLLDAVLRPAIVGGFSVSVYEGPYLLFGPVWQESGPEAMWEKDATLQMDDLLWTIQVWPGEEMMKKLESSTPRWVLAFGLFLALLVAAGVDRLQTWKRRALAAEAARREPVAGGVPPDQSLAPVPEPSPGGAGPGVEPRPPGA